MRIAVVNNCVPFLNGGAEHLASALTTKLKEYGHQSILVRIPFQWRPPQKIFESILACRLMRFDGVDRVIALKFPAYHVQHPDKMLWLLHQFRQAYDLWGTPWQDLPDTQEGRDIRNSIVESDNACLSQVKIIYTNSSVVSQRLKQFNGIDSQVLYPPLLEDSHLRFQELGDYLFYPSRITETKRQHLAVEAMAYVKSGVRLVVAGHPELPADEQRIRSRIEKLGIEDRVTLIPKFITEAEKAEWLGFALGCIYIPYDEDSYGYVSLEAYHCRKPVITCTDSGGTSLVVKHEMTGLIAAPDPKELAAAMDKIFLNRKLAKEMGEAGYNLMNSMGITWDRVIECLTNRV